MSRKKYKIRPEVERFWSKVKTSGNDTCWTWTSGTTQAGYGKFGESRKGRTILSHRYSYKIKYGKIPDGLFVCHHCDNPPCVNPKHLFLGTQSDNQIDSSNKKRHRNTKKTHCPQGHPYSKDNTYIYPDGGRDCRICRKKNRHMHYQLTGN